MIFSRKTLLALRKKLFLRKTFQSRLCEIVARNRYRPYIEVLEQRRVLATFLVTNINDSGAGSLRQAIVDSNASVGIADTIQFSIGSGLQTIAPNSQLPSLFDSVDIDATSQPGFVGTPLIELRGDSAGAGASGFIVSAPNSTIRGFTVNRFGQYGVLVQGGSATGNSIVGNWIGTSADGLGQAGNQIGVAVTAGASGNFIGGTTATPGTGAGNVISGNTVNGVHLEVTNSNQVSGNVIGLDRFGSLPVGNVIAGVYLVGVTTGNVIGGPTVAHRNIISGNQEGIDFAFSGASSNSILNNYVGTNLNGTLARPNTSLGVFVVSDGNTIGGPGAGNLISGNTGDGLSVIGSSNLIQANYIGTNALGTTPVANAIGISIVSGASNNVIGGTVASARNVVSGNTGDGVFISGNGSTGNTVIGNYIGTNASGTAPIGNNVGVDIRFGATGNRVGGATAGERNTISGNVIGVSIADSGTTANRVSGNYVGTDWTGTSSVGNISWGVLLYAGASANIVGTNGDGTTDSTEGNLISGNSTGIHVQNDADNNIIAGNFIGTNFDGTVALGNTSQGIRIFDVTVTGTRIGTNSDGVSDTFERNIVSANTSFGIYDTGGVGTVVAGNYIGTNSSGSARLGNQQNGVVLLGASNARIGTNADGTNDAAERNIISGSIGLGVELSGVGATNITVAGNYIGTNASGTAAIANTTGVLIEGGASHNTIGGSISSARNVISGNVADGISIQGAGTTNNTIAGNYIGVDVNGNTKLANGGYGVILNTSGVTSNTIGGLTGTVGSPAPGTGPGNVISGNSGYQIFLAASGQTVQGNLVGLGADGGTVIDVALAGIADGSVNNSLIGGMDVRARNVISGLAVSLNLSSGSGTRILNNYIGTDVTGSQARGSGPSYLYGPSNLTIGAAGAGNVWSASSSYPISGFGSNWTIQGNRFGTTADGSTPLHNTYFWNLYSLTNFVLGGTGAGEGNQIADQINIADSTGGTVQGNTFGLNAAGTAVLAGSTAQLSLYRSAGFTIGGSTDAARNVFASGGSSGIAIQGFGADGNVIRGNYFGTNTAGTSTLGSFQSSIYVSVSAANNTIDRNVIAKGSTASVFIDGGNSASRRDIPDFAAAWFKAEGDFDNGTGYQQPGLAVGTVSFGTGVAGQAFQFSRATPGYVKSEHIASYTLDANNVSVESWINPATLPTAGQEYYIGSNGDANNPNFAAFLTNTGGSTRLAFRYRTSTGSQTATSPAVSFGTGSFHHIAVTTNGTNVKFYVDGTLFGIVVVVGSPQTFNNFVVGDPSVTLYIGGGIGVTNRTFDGKIDELAIYNRALTAAEISRIFSIGGADKGGNWTRNTTVTGNIIGLLADGTTAGAIIGDGIKIDNSESNTIGGTTAATRNIISNASGDGVKLTSTYARFNMVAGNYIGTDVTGLLARGNTYGVSVASGASNNTIGGGSIVGAGNLISGNTGAGVTIQGAGSSGNKVQGNRIGLNAFGSAAVANSSGVLVAGAGSNNIIGVDGDGVGDALEGNLISGNFGNGGGISISGSSGVTIAGNVVGLDATGTLALPNQDTGAGYSGVVVSSGNRIGTNSDGVSDELERNVIAGNIGYDLLVAGNNNTVAGNYVGLNVAGNAGIGLSSGLTLWSNNNLVGTNADGVRDELERNVVAAVSFNFNAANNTIAGNFIGTTSNGLTRLASAGGIELSAGGGSGNLIGGPTAASRNIVASQTYGIDIRSSLNTIQNNFINVTPDGNSIFAMSGYSGVEVVTANNLLVGNTVAGFASGIRFLGAAATSNTASGNYIGTNSSGTSSLGNTYGVSISSGASNNTLGGSSAAERNVISGNIASAVVLTGATTTGNALIGNYIGLGSDGSTSLGNEGFSVFVNGAPNNTIGGLAPGEGNVISATTNLVVSTGAGIVLYPGADNTRILGNRIGTDATGNLARPNHYGIVIPSGVSATEIRGNQISSNTVGGIDTQSPNSVIAGNFLGTNANGTSALGVGQFGVVVNATNVRIGGVVAADRNIISGHNVFGIAIQYTATGVQVQGNYIGTNATGTAAIANGTGVVIAAGSQGNTIGGTTAAERNIISGNIEGILIRDIGTFGNGVSGNYIGTDVTGTTAIANGLGVRIDFGASSNTIGGITNAERNVISGNTQQGVLLKSGPNNRVQGNYIGTNAAGTAALANSTGVGIGGASNIVGTNGDGVNDAAERNVISGNTQYGVNMNGATDNKIAGNYIGTNAAGTARLVNGFSDVATFFSTGNIIGTDGSNDLFNANERNVIRGSVILQNANVFAGNYVGMNAAGTAALDANPGLGVQVSGTTGSRVGTNGDGIADIEERNVISGINGPAVLVSQPGAIIAGNYIGTDPTGSVAIPNQRGVDLGSSVTGVQIGTNADGLNDAAERNIISGNTSSGVSITGTGTTGNTIAGNYIGILADGMTAASNGTGITIKAGASNNTIGGASLASRNIISGNSITGVLIDVATGISIGNNWIGVNAFGIATPNAIGVRIVNNSPSNTISDNEIRYSTSDNILIESASNILQRNVSADIGGLPIRLNPSSLSPGLVTITQVVSGANPLVLGDVQARQNTTYTVELFTSTTLGQASRYVQSASVTTDASGFATFSIAPPAGQMNGYVHATLTGLGITGATSTSQLSNGILATPAIILGLRSQSPEGTPITLTAFASSNPVTGYLWEVKKDGLPYAFELRTDGTQSDGGIQFTPDDEGVFTVSLRVTLADGSQAQLGPFAINAYNVAPTPSFNYAPSVISAGTVVTLTSNNSDPGQLDVLRNSWEIRSGSPTGPVVYSAPLSSATSASFTPAAGGFYYATMTVDDGDGGVRTLTREIEVNGLPASTTIVVPDTSVREGQTVRARAPETELNRTEQLTFVWTVIKTPAVGPNVPYPFTEPSLGVVEFVPNDDGVYTIGLTIISGASSVVAAPQQVVAANVAPRIQITGAPHTPAIGTPISLGSLITDPGTADTHVVTWTVTRDRLPFGTTVSGSSFAFTPNIPGVYLVTANATDDDGGVGTTRTAFNLSDGKVPLAPMQPIVPPRTTPGYAGVTIIAPSGPYVENTSYSFSAIVPPGVASYSWRARSAIGIGATSTGPTLQFTPRQAGDYLIELTVTLTDGRVGSAFFAPMSVQGMAPTISTLAVVDPSTGPLYEGTPFTVRALAVDSGETIGLNYQWELKKPGETVFTTAGGVDGAPADFRFLPTDDGLYEVRVSVTDSEGLTVQQSLNVTVLNADPLVRLDAFFDTANSGQVKFTAITTDPGVADTPDLRYEWSVNNGGFSSPSTLNAFTAGLSGLTQLSVRVTDGDGGIRVRSYFVLQGTPNNDTFTITGSNTTGAGADDQILYLALDGNDNITIDGSVTKKVVVLGGKGNDIINASAATVSVLLDGGEGNDTLIGGVADDVLIAGPGTNALVGGNGNNRFVGGGNDTMIGGVNSDYYEVHFSTVVLEDLGGIDTIDLTGAQSGVQLNLSNNTGSPQPVFAGSTLALTGLFEKLIGSQYGDDLTTNTSGTDIDGGQGNDRLVSGASGTKLSGGDGDDTFVLNNAAGTFDGGTGNDNVSGTLLNVSLTSIATGAGNDIVNVQGATTGSSPNVSISLGGGVNTLTASRVSGKIYANNGASSAIDVFGSASPATSIVTVSSSSDIDIFGSASPGSSVTVTSGANIDIYGSGALSLAGVTGGRITSSIFGSATTAPMVATVSSSTNIDIFGSASPTGPGLTATVSGGSSNIDIFGSASPDVSTVTVTGGSSDIDIFGSASPTGSTLNATVSSSNNIDIFGSASTSVSTITVNGGSSYIDIFGTASTGTMTVTVASSNDIDIFGSASPTAGGLNATISSSSNVDIFGSASTGVSTIIVDGGSSNIDIFGSASPTGSNLNATISNSSIVDIFGSASTGVTTVTVNGGSSDIDIFGSASPTGSGLTATISGSSNVDIFGSASTTGMTTVTVNGGSTDIGIFGSASPTGSGLTATISNSSNVDIFGSASTTGVSTLTVKDGSSDIDIFGSASPTGSGLDVTISSSSNVDIFGSASTGVTTVLVNGGSSDIDIFGSASPTGSSLDVTISSSSNVDIFGSASATVTTVIVSSSQDIDIFGSASTTGSGLDVTISSSSNVDIFGSASTTGVSTITVKDGSSNIDIFGSASPTGSVLNATVSNSSNIDIFGSASTGVSTIAVTSSNDIDIFGSASPGTLTVTITSSSDVDIFGSASPTGSTLNATVSNSSDIDIFGSANPTNPGSITVSSSQDIDIFGSASTGTAILVSSSSDIDIYGGYGDNVTLNNATRTRVEGGFFGSASVQGITVTVTGGSSDIGIFGTSLQDNVTVGPSSRVGLDLRDGADIVQVDGAQHFVALTDSGVDRVTIRSGFDMLIYLGVGDDQAEVIGGDLIRVIGEFGNDEFLISGGTSLTVDGGEGNDRLFVTGGRAITIRGDAGDDVVDIYGGIGISAVGGVGNEQMRIYGSLGGALDAGKVYALLDGQDGNDVLEVRPLLSVADRGPIPFLPIASIDVPYLYAPAWMALPQWVTAPTVTTFASSIALLGGSGNNSIWLEGAQRLYGIGGDDVDTINLQAGSNSEVAGGRDADIISVYATGSDNRVFGDQDKDTIRAFAGTRLGIFGEEGADTIEFHGGKDGFARGGEADDGMKILDGQRMVLAGETGNDTETILGGVSGVAAGGIGDDTLEISGGSLGLLLGQSGNDHLIVSGGTQSILSGGDGDDQIDASNRGDDLYGDDGDDTYRLLSSSSTGQLLRLRELLYVDSTNFEPQSRGSDTIDLSAFNTSASLNLGTLGVFNDLNVGVQSVISAQLQLILLGSLENIIGTSANDTLIGNSESNRIEGRGGNDTIFGGGGDDILEGGTGDDVIDGGGGDDLYLFATDTGALGTDTIYEANNGGIDGLDFSDMPVGLGTLDLNSSTAQPLGGGLLNLTLRQSSSSAAVGDIEEVVGTNFDDTILGNSLDNRIEPKGGNDIVDGRGGSDIYVFAGRNLGSDQVIDAPSGSGRDTLDFTGFDAPVVIDLALTTSQNLSELTLTLGSGNSIENVLGSSFDDTIYGNALDNALFGAAGADRLEGRGGNDRLVGDLPAVVLLDFDSDYRADRGDYNYSQVERDAIQLRLTAAYSAFNWTFTQYASVVPPTALPGSQSARALTADNGRNFVRIAFSEGRGGGISGDAGEVDFRNTHRRLVTEVNVNPLLPTVRQLVVEQFGVNYTPQQYSDLVVAFTSTVAGHELGHTAGLRHGDAFGPIGSGYFVETETTNVYPADTRGKAAVETDWHLLASPASVGTPLSSAAHSTFFGERESIKLAFDDIGRTRREAATAPGSHSTRASAEDLGSLAKLYVPNLAPATGFVRSGQSFDVSAMAVVGDLKPQTNSTATEVDYYRFQGVANEIVNVELLVSSIRPLRGAAFDGELRIFKSDGTLLAFNDDDFEGTKDPTLLDVVLPEDGTYYISVGLSEQPAIASPGGRYELFVSRFRVGTAGPVSGDTLVGGAGNDVLTGSAANDTFLGTGAFPEDFDVIDGRNGYDTLDSQGLVYNYTSTLIENVVPYLNTPPVVNLDGNNSGGTSPNFTVAFVEDAGAKNISDTDSFITDAENAVLANLKLIVSANPDGAAETLAVAGVTVPLNVSTTTTGTVGGTIFQVAYVATTRTFTITRSSGSGAITDFQSLLRGVTYNNLSDRPNTTPRTITVTASDGVAVSTVAKSTITLTAVNDAPTATFNIPTTSILVNNSFSVSLTNPVDPDTASGFTYAFDVGGGYGAFGSSNSIVLVRSVVGPLNIRATINDNQGGTTEYTGTVNIVLATGSAYILNLTASGAVTASGNANVNLPFGLFVDASSPNAIIASGNARINVGGTVQVVGGVSKSGNAQVTKTGVPASTNDPLSSLTSPGLTGLTNYGAVSVAGNTTRTLSPGVYTSIQLSGNANVTMSPGMYIIKGGGFTVSGNAGVSGSRVTIFNAGSNYNGSTDGGNFGGISLSGNGNLNLNPPTTGTYAGILIYQSRVNTRALSISGNANVNVNGTIYAANAALTMSGNGQLDDTLVVNTLNISGNIALTQLATGSDSVGDVGGNANTLLAGDLNVYISSVGGSFSSNMLARIRDAITSIDTLLVPYSVSINEVSEPSLATVIINTSMTSASGTAAVGILGSYDPGSNPVAITFLQGWDWYAGVDPVAIGASQYDFQTSVMHELGHALGLGHSSDAASAMNATLSTRTAHRVLTVADFNIPSIPEGVEPLTASGFVREQVQLGLLGQPDNAVRQVIGTRLSMMALATPAVTSDALSSIFVGALLGRGADKSMIDGRFGDPWNAKLPAHSLSRLHTLSELIPSRQLQDGSVRPATQRKNGNMVRSIHAVREESVSATAVDAAMAELYATTDKAD